MRIYYVEMSTPEIEGVPTRWTHSPSTYAKREHFVEILEEACGEKGIDVTWVDQEKWAGELRGANVTAPIYGYDLGLNSSASSKIADSKADTYHLLARYGIPAIVHERVSPNLTCGRRLGVAALAMSAIENVGLPLVAKPDALASGGTGVELCHAEDEVVSAIERLTHGGSVAAVSPYDPFDEYRAVVLGGETRAVIRKTRPEGSWMHNHSKGAEHRLVDPTEEMYRRVGELGVWAAGALDLHFATVDVAHLSNGHDKVLEVNESVSVVYPEDPKLDKIARSVYGDAALMRLAMV